MKTWDDWSDFDISFAVAKFVAIDGLVESNGKSVHIPEYHKRICLGWKTFWVSNPADMWPIIVENNITTAKHAFSDDWECFGGGYQVNYDHEIESFSGHYYSDKNPLRAAAIVFLMMNGVNPE